jgi:hypothetical protein
MGQAAAAFGPARFNLPAGKLSAVPTETNAVPTGSPDDHDGRLLHPGNPLMAFGALAAIVFGLMAFSTSVRVGKTTAGIKIGETT